MVFGLRTTIFWNLALLMALAIALISVVVLRVTDRELGRQREYTGTAVFSAVAESLRQAAPLDRPNGTEDLQRLIDGFARAGLCRDIILVDGRGMVVARAGGRRQGQFASDADVRHMLSRPESRPRVRVSDTGLSVTGHLPAGGRGAGALKIVLPLPADGHRAARMIFLYIVFDAVVLIGVGMLLLTRYVVRPVNRLIRLTETISFNDPAGLPVMPAERSEVGTLAHALRALAERLRQERATIAGQVRDLEEKNRQLCQARQETLQAEKLAVVGRLAAGLAHEIGNPVNIIQGYLHMLRRPDLDSGRRDEYLDRAERETERVGATVRDLLDFARPGEQVHTRLDLTELVRTTWTLVAGQEGFSVIRGELELDAALPPVLADGERLRQLVVNLLLNARDAMPDGGTLTLRTWSEAAKPVPVVLLSVADTGPGIAPQDRARVFEPFFSTKPRGSGTGMGLANAARIAEEAGGTIQCAGEPGGGAVFTVRLPAAPDSPPGD